MIEVHVAESEADRRSVVRFFGDLAALDAAESARHGVSPDFILAYFHTHDADPTAKYRVPGARLLIAMAGDVAAGCVAIDAFDAGTAEVHRLYVDPAVRGQGAGRALMQAALDEAAALGYRRMVLQTATFLTSAIALYESIGFAQCAPIRESAPEVAHLDLSYSRLL